MSKTQVVTLRMPVELKERLERQARSQGVSVNQLSNYLLNLELTQLETISRLELRLERKSIPELKKKVDRILDRVPHREVPDWDSVES